MNFIENLNCFRKNSIDETQRIPFTPRGNSGLDLVPSSLFTPTTGSVYKCDLSVFWVVVKDHNHIDPTCLAIKSSSSASSSYAVPLPEHAPPSSPIYIEKGPATTSSLPGQRQAANPPKRCSASFNQQSHSSEGGPRDRGRRNTPSSSSSDNQNGPQDRHQHSFHPGRKDRREQQDKTRNNNGHPKHAFDDAKAGIGSRFWSQGVSEYLGSGGSSFFSATAGHSTGKQYDPGGTNSISSLVQESTLVSLFSSPSKYGYDSGYSSRAHSKLQEILNDTAASLLQKAELLCVPCTCEATTDCDQLFNDQETAPQVFDQAIHHDEDSFLSSFDACVEYGVPTFQLDCDTPLYPSVNNLAEFSLLPPTIQPFLSPYD